MPDIYDISFIDTVTNLLPILKRKPIFVSWLTALLSPVQWLHDNFFSEYVTGSTSSLYSGATAYVKGDRVIDDLDNGVWESQTSQTGVQPSTANDTDKWQNVSKDWRGSSKRVKYDSKKITLEYVLNEWFRQTWVQPDDDTTPTRPAIYIDNVNPNNLAFVSFETDSDSSDSFYSDTFQQNFVVDSYSFSNYWFTIYVPVAFYTSLGATADNKIRAIADQYVIAGVNYTITTY